MHSKYSVLMSVYKKESPLNLRDSVTSMMNQTVPPSDFVLYCDGKLTKELYLEIERLRNRFPVLNVIYGELNLGLGNALRNGIDYCKHDIVARMDSDDIAKPRRMEMQLAAFEKYQVDIVSGTIEEFADDITNVTAVKTVPKTNQEIIGYAKRRNPFNHPCVTFRKQQVYLAGNYEHCPFFEDYWLWVRMLQNGCKGYNVQETVLYMRSGSDLYKRRGGFSYTVDAIRFRKKMKQTGFCGFKDYMISCMAHIVVAIIPNRLRRFVYSKFLRR